MKAWTRWILPAMVLAMAVWSPAPIIDQNHRGNLRDDTQADLERQQQYNGTVDVVGGVVTDTTPNDVGKSTSNPDGRSVFNAAENQAEKAAQTIREASKTTKEKSGPNWLWAGIVAALGFGSVLGVRAWANKTIQPPPKKQKVRW
ncbi:MAG: hypothetical protein KF784_01135 [Fimbriimonadaceae bacterium]|nr:hypothetical protein [Fimbriimonadaceae bacterium]